MSRAAAFGSPQVCTGNGDVALPYGDVHYFGLGLSVMIFLVFIQVVGSPFMKNCSVALALFFGFFVAGVSSYTAEDGTSLPYVNGDKIEQAGVFTFLWTAPVALPETSRVSYHPQSKLQKTTTFNIGFYPPAFIPLLLGFVITAVETVGDIQASCDVSGLPIEGPDADSRIQGGLLADGVNSFLACLMTCPPNTTFSQNNGVIAITRCASRAAGIACCFWLIVLGCFEKFGAAIASIPDAVLGGMTTFLFANVLVSGINIVGGSGQMGRRTRFILAVSLGVGVGVAALPNW
ncbi:uapC, partial [Symbiodinium necroappetens]